MTPASRTARTALALVAAGSAVAAVAAPCSAAAGQVRLRYGFDQVSNPVRTVADDSGNGQAGTARGRVTSVVGRGGRGRALHFPGKGADGLVETKAGKGLNPGRASFSYGAAVRVPTEALSARSGSNVLQKGLAGTGQWKLQIDPVGGRADGRPSCVLRTHGGKREVTARSSLSVADSHWHEVVCHRDGDQLLILVDGVQRGQAAVPTGLDVDPGSAPVTLGAKGSGSDNDQYRGDLDDVFFGLDG